VLGYILSKESKCRYRQTYQLFNMIYVNIFDLVEATRLGLKTRSFPYAGDPAVYSRAMGRVFPLLVVKEDAFFKTVTKVWVRRTSSGKGEGTVGNALGENVTWVDWNAWGGQRSAEFQ
jgi:hypothetical protein